MMEKGSRERFDLWDVFTFVYKMYKSWEIVSTPRKNKNDSSISQRTKNTLVDPQ